MNQAILKINNCIQCPYMKKVQSPPTGDSFDAADEDAVCTKARGSYNHNGVKGRAIEVSERWWKPKHTAIPDWCPIKVVKNPADRM